MQSEIVCKVSVLFFELGSYHLYPRCFCDVVGCFSRRLSEFSTQPVRWVFVIIKKLVRTCFDQCFHFIMIGVSIWTYAGTTFVGWQNMIESSCLRTLRALSIFFLMLGFASGLACCRTLFTVLPTVSA